MWLQCVSTSVCTYVQYVSVYLCMCVRVYSFIIHRVLYLRRFLTLVRLVVPLFSAAIAYTDHTYSDRVCVVR